MCKAIVLTQDFVFTSVDCDLLVSAAISRNDLVAVSYSDQPQFQWQTTELETSH